MIPKRIVNYLEWTFWIVFACIIWLPSKWIITPANEATTFGWIAIIVLSTVAGLMGFNSIVNVILLLLKVHSPYRDYRNDKLYKMLCERMFVQGCLFYADRIRRKSEGEDVPDISMPVINESFEESWSKLVLNNKNPKHPFFKMYWGMQKDTKDVVDNDEELKSHSFNGLDNILKND